MVKQLAQRLGISVFAAGLCALLAGCLSGNPTYFPYILPGGEATRSHAKPAGLGYFANFDPHAYRLEVRPEICNVPVRGTQVLLATVYDRDGTPRRKRRVEWMIEGPGSIVEVDESGYLAGRGMKVDNKYAFSHTDYFEHTITRGNDNRNDDFVVGPGQTWCVITSAVEGQTNVIVYAPEIADWERNKVYVKLNWVDANLQFPPPVTARAGGEYVFATRVGKPGDGNAAGFRVRYKIIDGPPAALAAGKGTAVESVTEALALAGDDGYARVRIAQPAATAGANRVAVEVIKPAADNPGQFTVVSKGETKITWQAPQMAVTVTAPKIAPLNQDVAVTYGVASTGGVETQAVTVTAAIPDGMDLIRTEPRAVQDGDLLIWTLPALGAGKQHTVQAVYRSVRIGSANVSADARAADGLKAQGSAAVQVAEAKLSLNLEGPATGIVGEPLPFKITVTNGGDGPAEQVRVKARMDDGLETTSKSAMLDETIDYLSAGQSKTISLPVSARRGGKFNLEAGAAAANNLLARPQSVAVEIQDARLGVKIYGPGRAYVGQDVTWRLIVQNPGAIPLNNVQVKATLPQEMTFESASDGGRLVGKQIVWDVGSAPAGQEKQLTVTGTCGRLSDRAVLTASVGGDPVVTRDGVARTVSLVKPLGADSVAESALEIIGVAALQMSVTDADDPVRVGRRTTYTIRVKNAGTSAAKNVEVSADVPAQMRPIRAAGGGNPGKMDGQKISFPAVATIAAGAEISYVVEVEAVTPGQARFRAEAKSPALAQPIRTDEPTRVLGSEAGP